MKNYRPSTIDNRLFGTDGIRGTPGVYPLTDEMIAKIAKAVAQVILSNREGSKKRPQIVIGKDTRLSGQQIERNLADSLSASGVDVLLAGIITTPGLSFLVKELNLDLGVMISASHNKYTDNGLKFFNSRGFKLSCGEENKIEALVHEPMNSRTQELANSRTKNGNIRSIRTASSKYVQFLISTVQGLNLKGMHIALDCASGSASIFAKQIFKQLKAKVHSINDNLLGENINVGGAIEPSLLRIVALARGADIGIALDGDGDRGILIDEEGNILDGDYIMAITTSYLIKKNKLPKNTIVATEMSNYGLKTCLENMGAKIIFTKVGDKHVLEGLLKNSLNLGGEQSGHIIFLDYLPTPDGLLTALQILRVMQETGSKLSELSKCITKFPQVLVNVKVREKRPFEELPYLEERLQYFKSQLKDKGRILLRYSGTEPLARVMVEGKDKDLIENIANSLAEQIRQEIGI